MKDWIRRFWGIYLDSWDAICVEDAARLCTNNILFFFVIVVVSFIMMIVNVISRTYNLLVVTASLFVLFSVLFAVLLLNRKAQRTCTYVALGFAYVMSAYFLYSGGTQGFSAIWLCVFPLVSVFLGDQRQSTAFNIALFLLVCLVFYTPVYGFLAYEYTDAFRFRFPVIMFFVCLCAWVSELMRSQTQLRLAQLNATLKDHALTDQLTGLGNRYAFTQFVQAQGNAGSLAYAVVDVDLFKQVNDTYGHGVGDEVLKQMASLIRSGIRPLDRVFRWGGEEFLIVLPRLEFADLTAALERVRAMVETATFTPSGTPGLHITISIGGAAGYAGLTSAQCIVEADQCLYRAKQSGRNRVVAVDLYAQKNIKTDTAG